MENFSRATAALGIGLALLSACTSPTEPDPFGEPPPGTYQSALSSVVGAGEGGTSVTPVAHAQGFFAGTMRFRVRGKPNTTYKVMRAADVGKASNDDGVCQRGEGASPWSAADGPAYVQFPIPFAGPLLVIQTDSRGEGSLDYNYESPQIPRGYKFDVRMRLVDDENAPTTDLRSRCMTIEVL
jgi:hypothetical protein